MIHAVGGLDKLPGKEADAEKAKCVTACAPRMLSQYFLPPSPPTLRLNPLPLSFSAFHFAVREDSCAAAAILNYIGQWEIVFVWALSSWLDAEDS